MKNNTMSRPQQTDKEFVEAAKISEQNIFIAVAIRRITGLLLCIPIRELVTDATFDEIRRRAGLYADWDKIDFMTHLEWYLNEDEIDWAKVDEVAKNKGYPDWFYNPDNYKNFSFFGKPFVSTPPTPKITYGEWVHLITEKFLVPVCDKITLPINTPPTNWTGIETSDLVSDTLISPSPSYIHILQSIIWSCLCVFAAIPIFIFVVLFVYSCVSLLYYLFLFVYLYVFG
jgi:hypothetical protein